MQHQGLQLKTQFNVLVSSSHASKRVTFNGPATFTGESYFRYVMQREWGNDGGGGAAICHSSALLTDNLAAASVEKILR